MISSCCDEPVRELAVPMPWTGQGQQAKAVWGVMGNPIPANVFPEDVAYKAAAYNARSMVSTDNLGGLNPEINQQPFYDPRSVLTRAPVETVAGSVISAPSLAHGPSLFTYSDMDVRPKTQFAPQGEVLAERMVIDAAPAGEPCGCSYPYPYSVAALFLDAGNVEKIRAMLVQEGVFVPGPGLMDATAKNSCGCKILGGRAGLYCQLAQYSQQYEEVSVIQLPNPVHQVNFFNTVYVQRVVADVKSGVINQARANYLRAETNRAYLQDAPAIAQCTTRYSEDLPQQLPGTGSTVVPSDTLFLTRALTTPLASVPNRNRVACLSGLPIGANPYPTPLCATATPCKNEQTCPTVLQAQEFAGVSVPRAFCL